MANEQAKKVLREVLQGYEIASIEVHVYHYADGWAATAKVGHLPTHRQLWIELGFRRTRAAIDRVISRWQDEETERLEPHGYGMVVASIATYDYTDSRRNEEAE